MDYYTELNRINDKYYNKIKKAYSKYIKNFDSIPDLTQNVYIIPDNKCIDDYEDLAVGKNRGRCDADTGNIYIRESAFCEHLLIHEFIHRLSRNCRQGNWTNGLGCFYLVPFYGINELITEWIAFSITNIKEANNRQQNLFFLIDNFKCEHRIRFALLFRFYFIGDIQKATKVIPKKSFNKLIYINNYILLGTDYDKLI